MWAHVTAFVKEDNSNLRKNDHPNSRFAAAEDVVEKFESFLFLGNLPFICVRHTLRRLFMIVVTKATR